MKGIKNVAIKVCAICVPFRLRLLVLWKDVSYSHLKKCAPSGFPAPNCCSTGNRWIYFTPIYLLPFSKHGIMELVTGYVYRAFLPIESSLFSNLWISLLRKHECSVKPRISYFACIGCMLRTVSSFIGNQWVSKSTAEIHRSYLKWEPHSQL